MEFSELKVQLQNYFRDGLVIVVGSGLSCAEGLPGMGQLADYLDANIKTDHPGPLVDEWAPASALLKDHGLEAALLKVEISEELEKVISKLTAQCVAEAENSVISEVLSNGRNLKLSMLIPHLLKPDGGIPFITTNYYYGDSLLNLPTR